MLAASGHTLMVRVGDKRLEISAASVAEIIREPKITRVPNGPAVLLGVTHLRGTVLPVISLNLLLGGGPTSIKARRVVVLSQDPPVGLAVDSVDALRDVRDQTPDRRDDPGFHEPARWLAVAAALHEHFGSFRRRAGATPSYPPVNASKVAEDELAFLTFSLADQAYALPLEAVAEVVALTSCITALPQTEEVLLGVFPLRGAVLPALSLRAVLGLPGRAPVNAERVIVVRIGRHLLALVVDRVDAILRTPRGRVTSVPSLFNRGAGEAQIDAILRLTDGRGLVSILSPKHLLADERVAPLLSQTDQEGEVTMAAPGTADRGRFLVIRLGDESYGLPITSVDEVVRLPKILAHLPKAPAYVRGVMNLRGRVIPVIDQRQRFAVAGEPAGGERVVVLTLGSLQAGFAVDAASEILEVEAADLLPTSNLSEGCHRIFDRAARVASGGEVILLIDPAALLSRAEADLLRDLRTTKRAS